MAENNLLQHDTPVYFRFVDNQVLTNDQLNAVLDHINYQDKLSRTALIGVGIVCGLRVSIPQANRVRVSRGVAVTTDGDILKMSTTTYRGFKEFKDENARYAHFLDGDEPIPLYDLEEETSATDVLPLSDFASETGIGLSDAVAILYLEHYLKEEEDCSPTDCNAQGREVVNRLRVLLTSVENAQKVIAKDSILGDLHATNSEDILDKFDSVLPRRVILNAGNSSTLSALRSAYSVNFVAIGQRLQELSEISLLKPLLQAENLLIAQILNNISATSLNFQYVYDLYKDISEAYNELLEALKDEYSICCPDPTAFPKHVMLGRVVNADHDYRHAFYPSPIHDRDDHLAGIKARFLRILQMLKFFQVNSKDEERITLSRDYHFPIAKRALPYYYDLESNPQPGKMLNTWKLGNPELLHNYYKQGYPNANFEPLDYVMPEHTFFRIEGHVGKEVMSAVKDIKEVRDRKGLPFDIVPIAVGAFADENTIDYDKYSTHFEDLQVILQAWNKEQQCIVSSSSKFLTRFSVEAKGKHLDYLEHALVLEASEPMHLIVGEASPYGIPSKVPKDNAVLKNLDNTKGSLGAVYYEAIDASFGESDFRVTIPEQVSNVIVNWEPEIVEAAVNIPALLLGSMKVTEDNKLVNIEDFTEENLEKYIASLKKQCDAAKSARKQLKAAISKDSSALSGQSYVESYFFTINRLVQSCCLIEKVRVLYEKILERKRILLDKMVLKNYIKYHSGAEHKAGVPVGGTIIILYYSNIRRDKKPKRSISASDRLVALREPRETIEREANLSAMERLTNANREALINAMVELGVTAMPESNIGNVTAKAPSIAHGTVIGDLCLPYICCTDTPATTFVFPDQEVSLFIGRDYVCISVNGEAESVLLEVRPTDATVEAFIDGNTLPNAIVKSGQNTFFNPTVVPSASYGTAITFTVNGQPVSDTIRVLLRPESSFSIGNIDFLNNNSTARIIIENTSTRGTGITYNWTINAEEFVQDALKFEHFMEVEPGGTYSIRIKLVAANNECTTAAEMIETFTVPEDGSDDVSCEENLKLRFASVMQALERELELNANELGQVTSLYIDILAPAYKQLLADIEGTIAGEYDSEVFERIQSVQKRIETQLTPNMSQVQQAFLLRLYFEALLLYFHLQDCRDAKINARTQITGSWVDFIKSATSRFPEVMKTIVQTNKLKGRIEEILSKEDDRLSAPLKEILNQLLEILESISG